MAEPKKGLDVIIGLGGGKPPPGTDKPEEGEDLPMDYVASFKDYQDNPSPETFWEAVKSCVEAYNDKVGSDKGMKKNLKGYPGQADNFVERQAKGDRD